MYKMESKDNLNKKIIIVITCILNVIQYKDNIIDTKLQEGHILTFSFFMSLCFLFSFRRSSVFRTDPCMVRG